MEKNRVVRFAERLKDTRKDLGISQETVADYIGIPRSSISDIESGKRKVDALELELFSKLYKFPISYFYGEEQYEEQTIRLIARSAKGLTEVDREKVLKFAQSFKKTSSNRTSNF